MHPAARRRFGPQVIFVSPDAGLGERLASCLKDAAGNGCWPKEAGRPNWPSYNTGDEPETTSMT